MPPPDSNSTCALVAQVLREVQPMSFEERARRLRDGLPLVEEAGRTGSPTQGISVSGITGSDEWARNMFQQLQSVMPEADTPGSVARVLVDMAARESELVRHSLAEQARASFIDAYADRGAFLRSVLPPTEFAREYQGTFLPPGHTYAATEPEFFGRIPVRTELEVLQADPPDRPNIGWSVQEVRGVGMVNQRAADRILPHDFIPIESIPTINLDDVRRRRYGLTRSPPSHPIILALIRHRDMQRETPPPRTSEGIPGPSILRATRRRTVWERILDEAYL